MWEVKIDIEDKSVRFKVDTGAEVTVLSDSTWKSLKCSTPLKKAQISLCGPDQTTLRVIGEAKLGLSYKGKSSNQNVFVIKDLKNNLLGLPAIRALQLFSNVCSVDKSIISQYPSPFTGLGKFGHKYTIKLKPNPQPFALSTPRNIPLPMRAKVEAELQRMENLGSSRQLRSPHHGVQRWLSFLKTREWFESVWT